METKISEQYFIIIAIAETIGVDESLSSASTKNDIFHIQLPKIQLPNFDGNLLIFSTYMKILICLTSNAFITYCRLYLVVQVQLYGQSPYQMSIIWWHGINDLSIYDW